MFYKIFKGGNQTDSKGRTENWTPEILDRIVHNYNNQLPSERLDAPLIIGHERNDKTPAYGFIEKLRRAGDYIEASFKNITDPFRNLVNDGHYPKVSIGLRKGLLLDHLAFLGGVAPAIKGLPDIVFKDGVEDCERFIESEFKFSETEFDINNFSHYLEFTKMDETTKQNLLAAFKTAFGNNTDVLTQCNAIINKVTTSSPPKFTESEFNANAEKIKTLEMEVSKLKNGGKEDPLKEFADNPVIKEMIQKQKESDEKLLKSEFKEFVAENKSRLISAQITPLEKIFLNLKSTENYEFSENGITVKKNLKDLLTEFVKNSPEHNLLNAFAENGSDSNFKEQAEADKQIEEDAKRG